MVARYGAGGGFPNVVACPRSRARSRRRGGSAAGRRPPVSWRRRTAPTSRPSRRAGTAPLPRTLVVGSAQRPLYGTGPDKWRSSRKRGRGRPNPTSVAQRDPRAGRRFPATDVETRRARASQPSAAPQPATTASSSVGRSSSTATAPANTRPDAPSMLSSSPSANSRSPILTRRCLRSMSTSPAPTTQGLPTRGRPPRRATCARRCG